MTTASGHIGDDGLGEAADDGGGAVDARRVDVEVRDEAERQAGEDLGAGRADITGAVIQLRSVSLVCGRRCMPSLMWPSPVDADEAVGRRRRQSPLMWTSLTWPSLQQSSRIWRSSLRAISAGKRTRARRSVMTT